MIDVQTIADAIGTALRDGDHKAVRRHVLALWAAHPGDPDVAALGGGVLVGIGAYDDARPLLEISAPNADRLVMLSLCCLHQHDFTAAERYLSRAIEADPSQRECLTAWFAQFKPKPRKDGPAAHLLRFGDLRGGLRCMLDKLNGAVDIPGAPFFSSRNGYVPRWYGERTRHLAMAVNLPGDGDALQFVRYALQAAPMVDRLTFVTNPALVELFTANGLHTVALPALEDVLADASAQTDALAAAAIMKWDYGQPGGYLKASAPHDFGPGFHVGVNWVASALSDRSVAPTALAPLASVRGVVFHNLVFGERAADAPPWVRPLEPGDYARTANLMRGLRLVISVDSSPAHLAGALGVPVWVALPGRAEWRFGVHPTSWAWYELNRPGF